MEYKDISGIIVGEKKYKENDKIITFVTDSLGKISVLARGISKMNSKFSAVKLYSLIKMDLKEVSDDFFVITNAEKIMDFPEISKDLETQSYMNYILTVAKDLFLPGEHFLELFKLLANTMFLYDKGEKNKELIKCAFELRALTLSGFALEVNECSLCGNSNIEYINIYDGECLCHNCGGETSVNKLSTPVFEVIKHITLSDEKKVFAFKLGSGYIKELSVITTNYIKVCMEKEYSSLKFLRNIQKGLKQC